MILAELKSMFSTEADVPLEQYFPEDPKYFCLSVQLMIGTRGQEGADTFLTEICTPDWITEECDRQDGVWGYGKLTVTQWDFKIIRTRIERYVASCSGENWREIAQQLSKIGTWEFENYVS